MNIKKKAIDDKLKAKAPDLQKLAVKADKILAKNNLQDHTAKVALCLDISGSMSSLYRSGKIQKFAERILALGCRFDDDGSIDIFLFGRGAYTDNSMTIDNHNGFVNRILSSRSLEGGTYYGKAIKLIRQHYYQSSGNRTSPISDTVPVYVMFVTDGETMDKSETISQITSAAYEPIFWQFMGIGKSKKDIKKGGFGGFFGRLFASDFSFLENLDTMDGRFVDNANFFSLEDPSKIGDDQLYELLMDEYPDWLKLAKEKGLLR